MVRIVKQERHKARYIGIALFLIALAAMPFIVRNPYLIGLMVFIGLYSISVMGIVLLMGYAGQISLATSVFYGLGAYSTALLTTRAHFNGWLAMAIGCIISGTLAATVARPILKLPGFVLGGITFALALIFDSLAMNLVDFTGGATGITDIPRLSIGGIVIKSDLQYYVLVWIAAVLLLVLSLNLVNSGIGRALRSLHVHAGGSEVAAQTLGINTTNLKAQVFALSAVYASIAGSLFAHYLTAVNPDATNFWYAILVMIMAVIGGLNSPWGAFLGAGLGVSLTELLREFIPRLIGGPTGAYEGIGFGVIMVLVLLFLPLGLVSFPQSVRGWITRVRHLVWARQ